MFSEDYFLWRLFSSIIDKCLHVEMRHVMWCIFRIQCYCYFVLKFLYLNSVFSYIVNVQFNKRIVLVWDFYLIVVIFLNLRKWDGIIVSYLRFVQKSFSYGSYCYAAYDVQCKGLYVHYKSLRMAYWDILLGDYWNVGYVMLGCY